MNTPAPRRAAVVERARAVFAAAAQTVARARSRRGVDVGLRVAATLLALAATTYVFLVLNKPFFYAGSHYDEEFFSWGGWCIRKGLVLYRDFIEFKPPLVFLTHALSQALFGLNDFGFRTFFVIVPLAAVLALQLALIARGVGRALATASMLAIVSLFVNQRWHDSALSDSESIGVAYYLLGLALFLWEGRLIKLTTALGGAFMVLCVLSKEPFVAVVMATWLGMFWLRGKPGPTRASARLFARYSLIGVGAAVAVICLYMVPTGAMSAYLKMASGYGRIYSDPQSSYCVAVGVARPAPTMLGNLANAWARMHRAFLNVATLGYLVPFVLAGAIFAWRRRRALFVCMAAAAAGALWAPTASKCMWHHYYNMSIAGLVFIVVAGLDSMTAPLRRAWISVRVGVSVAALTIAVVQMAPAVYRQQRASYTRPPWSEPQPGLMAFIAANTVPSDRIFTTGTPALYMYADRVSAVRETNIIDEILGSYDGATDEEKLRPIREQLRRNRPKVVFLDPENEGRKHRHLGTLVMPFLAELDYRKINDRLYVRP